MKTILITASFLFVFSFSAISQSSSYWSGGMDMVFSWAEIDANGQQGNALLRWVPVVNIHSHFNTDFSPNFGFFAGIGIRNVGYIYNNYEDPVTGIVYKKKFRTYNLCVPLALKYGDLSKWYVYAGYEFELPFAYKEKTFDSGDKTNVTTGWFSSRYNSFQHGPFLGVRLPEGGNIKFKYYISEFHNQDFTDSAGTKPYAGLKANIFYFSVGFLFNS